MEETTIRNDQLRAALAEANARIRALESRLAQSPSPSAQVPATADTAKAWLDRSLAVGTYEGAVLVADRLARGMLAMDIELVDLRDRLSRREETIAHLADSMRGGE